MSIGSAHYYSLQHHVITLPMTFMRQSVHFVYTQSTMYATKQIMIKPRHVALTVCLDKECFREIHLSAPSLCPLWYDERT